MRTSRQASPATRFRLGETVFGVGHQGNFDFANRVSRRLPNQRTPQLSFGDGKTHQYDRQADGLERLGARRGVTNGHVPPMR